MKYSVGAALLIFFLLRHASQTPGQESAAVSASIDFNRDVRPILSNHCFQCHGEDADARKANLRLDVRSVAIEMQAIVPKQPNMSSLVARIGSQDPDEHMPPASANKRLSEKQIAVLTQWIGEGADYEEHWGFQRVVRPQTPVLPDATPTDSTWCRNEIDAFILQKLISKSLHPAPQADKAVLIRRLYQDLLGLLPSVAETEQFLQDSSPDACRTLVDRLCLTRTPDEGELDLLLNFHSRELSRFTSNPADAGSFVSQTDAKIPVPEVAAWASVARTLFNTDEFVSRN